MNEKLRKIINHYGIIEQLKYFQSEVFELNEAIFDFSKKSPFEVLKDNCYKFSIVFANALGVIPKSYPKSKKDHIMEEIADVMVMLKQFQLYYDIPSSEIKKVMSEKIYRQLERIKEEQKNDKCTK